MTIQVPEMIRVLLRDGRIVWMRLEEYLRGVVPQEMQQRHGGPLLPIEALKAQSVAARSYAASHNWRHADANVCTETHCQGWRESMIHPHTDAAILATAGQVITYGGRIAIAYFNTHCDGRTRSARAAFGLDFDIPYAVAVDCVYRPGFLGDHGVGLCQLGAIEMARAGATYIEILTHYYSGVEIATEAGPVVVAPARGPLPEDEEVRSPEHFAEKCRWWWQQYRRKVAAKKWEEAEAISASLERYQIRGEETFKRAA